MHIKWPTDFSVHEILHGFARIKTTIDDDPKVTKKATHPLVFHGCPYVKATVCSIEKILRDAPEHLKDQFVTLGDVHTATWPHFTKALKDFRDDKGKIRVISEASGVSIQVSENVTSTAPHAQALTTTNDEQGFGDLQLCPICDDSIDCEPSQKLLDMLNAVKAKTALDPTKYNPGHRSGASIRVMQPLCELHEFESIHLPLGKLHGWPETVDFDWLHAHIL
jgi:hypothetical protein